MVHALVFPRVDQIAEDRCFAELPAGFEPVQALHQDEAIAVAPDQDRRALAVPQDALGDFIHGLGIERGPALDRDVDARDRK